VRTETPLWATGEGLQRNFSLGLALLKPFLAEIRVKRLNPSGVQGKPKEIEENISISGYAA